MSAPCSSTSTAWLGRSASAPATPPGYGQPSRNTSNEPDVTPASPRRRGHAAAAEPARRDDTHAIREWARENGYQVPARGRISRKIRDAFAAAH